jgi:hypothetical protein
MSFTIDLPDDPAIDALPPEQRAVIAGVWTGRADSEQRSAAIFAVLARDLLCDGAVPEVLSLATRAVHDELRHAEICRRVATRYAGADVPWPGPPSVPEPAFRGATPALARQLYIIGNTCVAETAGAAFLQACRADAESPLPRAAIQQLMRDDIGHARIGWAHLASDRAPPELRAVLPVALPALLAAVRTAYFNRSKQLPDAPPPGHGCTTPQSIRAHVAAALRDIVVPGFEHLGVDTTRARRWLADELGPV